jgi:hypothetical protein
MIHNAAWPVGGSFLGTERGMPVQRNGRGFAARIALRGHCVAVRRGRESVRRPDVLREESATYLGEGRQQKDTVRATDQRGCTY